MVANLHSDHLHWSEPVVESVAEGVYRIPLPLPNDSLRSVNVYAICDGKTLNLIDGGWALEASLERLEDALNEIDSSISDIDQFLVTHVHRDHYTQAIAIRRRFGTRVRLGLFEQGSLEEMRLPGVVFPNAQIQVLRKSGAGELIQQIIDSEMVSPFDTSDFEDPDEWLRDGEALSAPGRELLVLHTPGHTNGHVVFSDLENGLLFAGDHLLPEITPSIAFEPRPACNPLSNYLASLAKVRKLPDLVLLPAHGPVTSSSHARIDSLLHHHSLRLQQCIEALRSVDKSAYEVAKLLRWTSRGRYLADLDIFNRMLAVVETKYHLDLLHAQREVKCQNVDSTDVYGSLTVDDLRSCQS